MKQLIQSYKTGELGIFDVPPPYCRDNGVLIRTTCSLVSAGTEKMIVDLAKKSLLGKAQARPDLVKQVIEKIKTEGLLYTFEKVRSKLDSPIPLGYSCSGVILETGKNIKGFSVGDRIACGGAGYANHSEVNYIPKNLFIKIPQEVEDQNAAYVSVGSIALQGVRQANPSIGERFVVIGLGLIGQLTVQLLKANGCRVLGIDPDSFKNDSAMISGADIVGTPEEISDKTIEFTNGQGADGIIITASDKSDKIISVAGEISRLKGRIIVVGLIGMNIPRDIYYKKELELKLSMSYGPGRYDVDYEEHGIDYPFSYVRWTEQRNFEAFLGLVKEKKVNPGKLTTHILDFDNSLNAYKLLAGDIKEKYLGILLNYGSNPSFSEKVVQLNEYKKISGVINTGFIGAGNFAKAVILPHIAKNKNFNLVGLSASTGISAQTSGRKYNFKYISSDNNSIFENPDINAVIITTRHDSHAKNVIYALNAGKHVFVEKPLCINEIELQEIADFYNSPGMKPVLQVGFNRRFSPFILRMKEELKYFPVSINYRVNAGIIPPDSWIQDPVAGGGRIIGEVCHFIDTCSFLSGSLPISIFASSLREQNNLIPEEDNVSIVINYENGSMANISYYASGNKKMPKEYIEVFAPNLSMQLHNFRKLVIFGESVKRNKSSFKQDKGFNAEFKAFADSVISGNPAIPFLSIYKTTKATFKVLESLKNKIPVSI